MMLHLFIALLGLTGAADPGGVPGGQAPAEAIGTSQAFEQLLEDLGQELRGDVSRLMGEDISPLALSSLTVSSNLSQEVEPLLDSVLTSALQKVEGLRQIHCPACFSVRSRIEGGDWVVSRGITSAQDSKAIAAQLGIKAFLMASLEWIEADQDYLALTVRIIRPSTGLVVFSQRYRSTETQAAALREGKKPKSAQDRNQEMVDLISGRPNYAHEAGAAYVHFPSGTSAVAISYRIAELFGADKSWLYGITLQPFATLEDKPQFGGQIKLGAAYTLAFPDVRIPRLRFGLEGGVYIAGMKSSTIAVGGSVDLLTHMNLGIRLALDYLFPIGNTAGLSIQAGAVWVFE